jgi:hypothetical protein
MENFYTWFEARVVWTISGGKEDGVGWQWFSYTAEEGTSDDVAVADERTEGKIGLATCQRSEYIWELLFREASIFGNYY